MPADEYAKHNVVRFEKPIECRYLTCINTRSVLLWQKEA